MSNVVLIVCCTPALARITANRNWMTRNTQNRGRCALAYSFCGRELLAYADDAAGGNGPGSWRCCGAVMAGMLFVVSK